MGVPAADSAETERLLDRIRAGDKPAVDRLFDRHRPYLRRVIELRLDPKLRPRVDPSDVVQEAQMEAHRRLKAYLREPAFPFRLWLRQIAYDRLLMMRPFHVEAASSAQLGNLAQLLDQPRICPSYIAVFATFIFRVR